jgi:predicted RNA binding protein YcfA (HicA-like mRNA interferase family)
MPRLPRVTGREVLRALLRLAGTSIEPRLLTDILRQADTSADEFRRLLE